MLFRSVSLLVRSLHHFEALLRIGLIVGLGRYWAEDLDRKFPCGLLKILLILGQSEVDSHDHGRGALCCGGIYLLLDPADITVGAIIKASEDDFALVECMGPARFCRINGVCKFRQLFIRALAAYFAVLDEMTLADAVRYPESLRSVLDIRPVYPGARDHSAAIAKPSASSGGKRR